MTNNSHRVLSSGVVFLAATMAMMSSSAVAARTTISSDGQSQRLLRRTSSTRTQQRQEQRSLEEGVVMDTSAALDAAATNTEEENAAVEEEATPAAAVTTADATDPTTADETTKEEEEDSASAPPTAKNDPDPTLFLSSNEPALCSPEWRTQRCPVYCNTPFLSDKCCVYHQQSASMLTISFPHNLAIYSRQEWFQNCTGANLAFTPYQAQGEGAFRPLFEVGEGAYTDATSSGVYDSYMTQAMAVNSFADKVEDISPRISATPQLEWTDILPVARKMGAYGKKQASMPFDLDFVSILLRDDLRAGYEEETGMKQPRTWEEFADYIEHWHGRDLNGDSIPDFGICSLNGAGPGGPQAMLMAIASSKLQYLGSNTGIWFDTENPEANPLFENEAFYQASELTRRLWMASIDDQPGGWVELHEDYWHNGRCAAYMWLTGSVALVLTKSPVRRCASYPITCANEGPAEWANRTVLWEPTHEDGTYWEPRRVRSMGSAQVYDRSDSKMKSCTPEITPKEGEVNCPYLDSEEDERDGVWINRTPYYYSAYQHSSISIRQDAPEEKKDLIWDFIVMANLESAPVVAQELGATYLDPFRRSHLTPETQGLYNKAWTEQQYEDLRKEFYFAGSNPNSGLPLSIPGSEEYELSMEMLLWQFLLDIGTDCTSKNDCKCRKYSIPEENCGYGWGSHPDVDVWERSRSNGKGSLTKEQFASRLKARWADITKTNGGGRAQINRYRATLGQDPLPEDDGWVIPLVIGLSATIGAIVLAIVGYWVYVTFRDKKRLLRQHEQLMEATLNESIRSLHQLDYPLHLVRGDEFLDEGKLRRHEVLRNTHKLTVLDSLGDVDAFVAAGKHIIFFSHQWTSFSAADPSNIQYETMCTAMTQLAKREGWGESLKDVFVWIDYSCIPQANPSTQNLAMRSLAAYASTSTYFIIVAPKCPHADLDTTCDLETYQRRTWCRAEQVCHSMRNGTHGMYLAEGKDSLVLVEGDFFSESLRVFDGELTCCRLEHKGMGSCDRQSLVIPLLGLFGELYRASREARQSMKGNPEALHSVDAFLKEIETHQESVFPRTFTRVMWRNNKRVEEEVLLFGELIDRMKARIDSGVGFSFDEDNGTGTMSTNGSDYLRHGASDFLRHGVVHGSKRSSGIKHGSSLVVESYSGIGSNTVTGMNSRNTGVNGSAMQEMAAVGANP